MTIFFSQPELLTPPIQRAAYSDRMAYILGEMSELAYFPFEQSDEAILKEFSSSLQEKNRKIEDVEKLLKDYLEKVETSRQNNRDKLEKNLNAADFELIETFNEKGTQAFLCRRHIEGQPPYLVLAFRGSEKKVDDWLTNADAIPIFENGYRIHSGFHKAFFLVKDQIESALLRPECRHENGKPLPLYITGHSLGGALAMVATKYIASDIEGACYTYGAPRIADYAFFFDVKTPIYRLVNSSDIVPRVPLGAESQAVIGIVKCLAWVSTPVKPLNGLFTWAEKAMDKLNGYRHYGDLRYLTDVEEGGTFAKVRLVYNPPWLDRVKWFFRHCAVTLFVPVKMHSLTVYREKLLSVAADRNTSIALQDFFTANNETSNLEAGTIEASNLETSNRPQFKTRENQTEGNS